MSKLVVTGSSGLIGSEVVAFFCETGWTVHGMDNNMRRDFFGPQGDTSYTDQSRKGDHIRYISDLSKMRAHFSKWDITKDLPTMFTKLQILSQSPLALTVC